jgi:hypothetical protein
LKLLSTIRFVEPLILIWEKAVNDKPHAISNNISLVFFNCIDYNVKLIDENVKAINNKATQVLT